MYRLHGSELCVLVPVFAPARESCPVAPVRRVEWTGASVGLIYIDCGSVILIAAAMLFPKENPLHALVCIYMHDSDPAVAGADGAGSSSAVIRAVILSCFRACMPQMGFRSSALLRRDFAAEFTAFCTHKKV